MKTIETPLAGLLIIEPRIFGDHRGFFAETHHQKRYQESGIDRIFVQDNISLSVNGTLRGLHFQIRKPQAKLVQALTGEIYDVVVDLRPESATCGQWFGTHLSEQNKRQLFIPEGFAHGFCVLSDKALFAYKCSDYYDARDEGGILWSDPALAIDWPVDCPIVSQKDSCLPRFSDWQQHNLQPEQVPDKS